MLQWGSPGNPWEIRAEMKNGMAAGLADWVATAEAFRTFDGAERERLLKLVLTSVTSVMTSCAARVASVGRTSVSCSMDGDRMRRVYGRLKCGDTIADLARMAHQIGPIAKFVINGAKTTTRGDAYPPGELQAVCDALDAALVALEAPSPAEDDAPTQSQEAPQSLAGLITQHVDTKFLEALDGDDLWKDKNEKKWLRSNVKEFLAGEVSTIEDLYTGKYAERAAVEAVTKMFRQFGTALVGAKLTGQDDAFNLGSNADAMRAAVAKAVETVIPQMWLNIYDKVLPTMVRHAQGRVARRARSAWQPVYSTRMQVACMPRRLAAGITDVCVDRG